MGVMRLTSVVEEEEICVGRNSVGCISHLGISRVCVEDPQQKFICVYGELSRYENLGLTVF